MVSPFARRQLTIDSVTCTFVIFQSKLMTRSFHPSSQIMAKSCVWITAALTISRLCVMVIVLWKSCSPRRFRPLCPCWKLRMPCVVFWSASSMFLLSLVWPSRPSLSSLWSVVSPVIWPGSAPRLEPSSFCFCDGFALWRACFIWLCYGCLVTCFRLRLLCSWPWSCSTCSVTQLPPLPLLLLLLFLLLFLLLLLQPLSRALLF